MSVTANIMDSLYYITLNTQLYLIVCRQIKYKQSFKSNQCQLRHTSNMHSLAIRNEKKKIKHLWKHKILFRKFTKNAS